jgi:hypothetical protein
MRASELRFHSSEALNRHRWVIPGEDTPQKMAARQEFKQEPGSGLPWPDTASDVVYGAGGAPLLPRPPPASPRLVLASWLIWTSQWVSESRWPGGPGGLARALSCEVPDSLGMNSPKSKLPTGDRHFRTSGQVLSLPT